MVRVREVRSIGRLAMAGAARKFMSHPTTGFDASTRDRDMRMHTCSIAPSRTDVRLEDTKDGVCESGSLEDGACVVCAGERLAGWRRVCVHPPNQPLPPQLPPHVCTPRPFESVRACGWEGG